MQANPLPHLDEHATVIAAEADDVWRGLCAELERAFSRGPAAVYARLVRAADTRPSGPRPLAARSAFPGFRVIAASPGEQLTLQGRHRFSSYLLIFRLEPDGPGRTRLRAESRAAFPGRAGRAYRRIVFGSGGHAVGMRRLLAAVRRASERPG
ncbi:MULTISPECIES: hypothetical protein [unclassified Streptomyces]|uniref:hypothetical protein n=1 Tax=unclassified Streptomyces TaxID=2593676 RepID=UPI00081DFB7E|nr:MULTISPECIES: hypothetical protein [unclassified Streptomyces]MYR93283.1 hypothetical protein [Streptomyces sp. SID4937]SCD49868.1 hypothetical protein GA0115243_102413 [Streptomyces sp. ScaeMP-e83]